MYSGCSRHRVQAAVEAPADVRCGLGKRKAGGRDVKRWVPRCINCHWCDLVRSPSGGEQQWRGAATADAWLSITNPLVPPMRVLCPRERFHEFHSNFHNVAVCFQVRPGSCWEPGGFRGLVVSTACCRLWCGEHAGVGSRDENWDLKSCTLLVV